MASYYYGQSTTSFDQGQEDHRETARPWSSSLSFQGPCATHLAMGRIEQLRRSKMQKVWKPVRLTLTHGGSGGDGTTVLWVQRETSMGTETLQRIPLTDVRSVGPVDEYMGERRFVVVVVPNSYYSADDPQVMFRCDNADACTKWVRAIRTTLEALRQPRAGITTASSSTRPAGATTQAAAPAPTPPPKPTPPPQDLLSFHVVTPTSTPQSVTAPPRPLGAADFDPLRQTATVSAPVSAPVPGGFYQASTSTSPTNHYHHPPHNQQSAPHSGGHYQWNYQHAQQQYHQHGYFNSQNQQHANLRHAILNQWALAPPYRQELRSLDQLVTTVHTVFGLVTPHAYFQQQWTALSYNDLCTHHVLDKEKVDKAVRKLKAFLHPDKWPTDWKPDQKFLCEMLWDVLHKAQDR